MSLRAVLFDLDGTLLDTSGDLAAALNALLQANGKPPLSLARIRAEVSNGANALVQLGFGVLSEEEHRLKREQLLAFYWQDIAQHTQPFDGINALIQALHSQQIPWGIATNKPQRFTERLMPHFTFAAPPAVVLSPEQVSQPKPHPAMLHHACDLLGCAPAEALYIGDHPRDIECGLRAGTITLAVGYGFTQTPTEHLQWGAHHAVDSAHQIWPLLQSHYL
jgi:N-acetyl-D-muramate 6-phosphate phosphatase